MTFSWNPWWGWPWENWKWRSENAHLWTMMVSYIPNCRISGYHSMTHPKELFVFSCQLWFFESETILYPSKTQRSVVMHSLFSSALVEPFLSPKFRGTDTFNSHNTIFVQSISYKHHMTSEIDMFNIKRQSRYTTQRVLPSTQTPPVDLPPPSIPLIDPQSQFLSAVA